MLLRGFPLPYEDLLRFPNWRLWILVTNIAIGLTAWSALCSARFLAESSEVVRLPQALLRTAGRLYLFLQFGSAHLHLLQELASNSFSLGGVQRLARIWISHRASSQINGGDRLPRRISSASYLG